MSFEDLDPRFDEFIAQFRKQSKLNEEQAKIILEQKNINEKLKQQLEESQSLIKSQYSLKLRNEVKDLSEDIGDISKLDECESKIFDSKVTEDAIVLDVPILLCCGFRLVYVILSSIVVFSINSSDLRVMKSITGFVMALSIFFEATLTGSSNLAKHLFFLVYVVGELLLWVSAGYLYEENHRTPRGAPPGAWIEFLVGGVIVIATELIIVFYMVKKKAPKTLCLAQLSIALSTSFLVPLPEFSYQLLYKHGPEKLASARILFLLFSYLHIILFMLGLPSMRRFMLKKENLKMANDFEEKKISDDSNEFNENQTFNHDNISALAIENEENDITASNQISRDIMDIKKILQQQQQWLVSLESRSVQKYETVYLRRQVNKRWVEKAELSYDIYAMMMVSKWSLVVFQPFQHRFKNFPTIVLPRPSRESCLGILVFVVQTLLASLALVDQSQTGYGDTTLAIPIRVNLNVLTGQFITLILAFMSQTDIIISVRDLLYLSYEKDTWVKVVDCDISEKNYALWFGQIFFPNFLKAVQGMVVLATSYVVILQADDIVDLLKDFTALFVISQIDDMFFILADYGYLGMRLAQTTRIAKKIEFEEDTKHTQYFMDFCLVILILAMFGGWVTAANFQRTGVYVRQRYPLCPFDRIKDMNLIGDQTCNHAKGVQSNIAVCGWEGGDCATLVNEIPDCKAYHPTLIDNGVCDGQVYNTLECGWEGGDCLKFNIKYPNCSASKPDWVGDTICDGGSFNTPECEFDGGDCIEFNEKYPDCKVEHPSWIGNKRCNGGPYNTTECGFDGGDCEEFNKSWNFTDCKVNIPDFIGDGYCNGGVYRLAECGFDGGDCIEFNEKYPNCDVEFPPDVGDGHCDDNGFNVEECEFDGGDCDELNIRLQERFPDCIGVYSARIGDGVCDGGQYNTKECDFDGGDCTDLNHLLHKTYPNCTRVFPPKIGDGFCDGDDYNTEECGFDGGDCDEFNIKYPNCKVPQPLLLNNGVCDGVPYHTEECGFDGGDCWYPI